MMAPPGIRFETCDDPPKDAALVVDTGLGDFNDASAPLHEVRPLAVFARDEAGAVIGGAIGRTWGACAELQQLWVVDSHRKRGIATRLVADFEASASGRGSTFFYLTTWSFQAPDFYRRLGYEVAVRYEGYGHGLAMFHMKKGALS